jgi:hypothetical protein
MDRPEDTQPRGRRRPAALVGIVVGAALILAGCGGSGGSDSTKAPGSGGSSTTAQASSPSTTTTGGGSSSGSTSSNGGSGGSGGSSSSGSSSSSSGGVPSGLPKKPGPAKKIASCLKAGNATVRYTPKANGYGALLADAPAGGQVMIVAAPSAAAAKQFTQQFKASSQVDVKTSNGGKTIALLTKSLSSSDRSLALDCAGKH